MKLSGQIKPISYLKAGGCVDLAQNSLHLRFAQ